MRILTSIFHPAVTKEDAEKRKAATMMESFPDSPMSPDMVLLLLLSFNFTSFILSVSRRTSCAINSQEKGCSSQEYFEKNAEDDEEAGEAILTSEDQPQGSLCAKTSNCCRYLEKEGHSRRLCPRGLCFSALSRMLREVP